MQDLENLTAANVGLSLSNQHKRHILFSGSWNLKQLSSYL